MLGKSSDIRQFSPDARLVLPTCRLGLEFEYEHVPNKNLPAKEGWTALYKYHEDNSLKDRGAEYVFATPLFGKDALCAIEGICKHATAEGWKSTLRTGIHVHMDVRDLEVPQLVGLCLLYALYEPVIYRWVGDERDANIFCLPWYAAEGGVMQAANIVRTALRDKESGDGNLGMAAEAYDRYAGLNLQALQKFGSVEFRHLKTTLDFDRILTWVNIILSLKNATFRVPTSDGAILREAVERGPTRFGMDVFGPVFGALSYPDLDKDVLEIGLPIAQELVRDGLSATLWAAKSAPVGENKAFAKFLNSDPFPMPAERKKPHGRLADDFAAMVQRDRVRMRMEEAVLQRAEPFVPEPEPRAFVAHDFFDDDPPGDPDDGDDEV